MIFFYKKIKKKEDVYIMFGIFNFSPLKLIYQSHTTGCYSIFGFKINYGTIQVNNTHKIEVVFPQCYNKEPKVFISVKAKTNLFNNKGNAIYVTNITTNGFKIISQNTQRLNDIAEEVFWFSIAK